MIINMSLQVIGPVIVDTTPPVFTGDPPILLELIDNHLRARWPPGQFADSSDPSLEYFIAVG